MRLCWGLRDGRETSEDAVREDVKWDVESDDERTMGKF